MRSLMRRLFLLRLPWANSRVTSVDQQESRELSKHFVANEAALDAHRFCRDGYLIVINMPNAMS